MKQEEVIRLPSSCYTYSPTKNSLVRFEQEIDIAILIANYERYFWRVFNYPDAHASCTIIHDVCAVAVSVLILSVVHVDNYKGANI